MIAHEISESGCYSNWAYATIERLSKSVSICVAQRTRCCSEPSSLRGLTSQQFNGCAQSNSSYQWDVSGLPTDTRRESCGRQNKTDSYRATALTRTSAGACDDTYISSAQALLSIPQHCNPSTQNQDGNIDAAVTNPIAQTEGRADRGRSSSRSTRASNAGGRRRGRRRHHLTQTINCTGACAGDPNRCTGACAVVLTVYWTSF